MQAEHGIHCWAFAAAGPQQESEPGKVLDWGYSEGKGGDSETGFKWLHRLAFTSVKLIPGLWKRWTHLGILDLFDMWGVMGQGYNFPSSSDKAIGSMTFSPVCLSLPNLQQSLCQICPGFQSVQSTWKSRWDCWLQILPTGRGRLDKCCWGVAGTAQRGAWQDGAGAAG